MLDTAKTWPNHKEDEQIEKALESGFLPSITTFFTIIRHPFLEKWLRKISVEHYMVHNQKERAITYNQTESSDLGSKLHDALEKYLLSDMKELPEGLTNHDVKLITPFLIWSKKNIRKVLACELSFGSKILGYGGTMDLACYTYDDHYLTADFKFKKHSNMYPMKASVEYGCQLSGYEKHFASILNEESLPLRRQNFLMNSGLGYSTDPLLKIVTYNKDFFPLMHTIQQLWTAVRCKPDPEWWSDELVNTPPPQPAKKPEPKIPGQIALPFKAFSPPPTTGTLEREPRGPSQKPRDRESTPLPVSETKGDWLNVFKK